MTTESGEAPTARGGKVWAGAYEALGHLGGLILAIMSGAVFLQVVMRFLGWTGIDGLDEVPRYLFVWLVMIGAAAAMYRGQHTVLDYFINLLDPRLRALVVVLTNAVGITGNPLNQNALDYLFGIATLVVGIWSLVELGCLRGTVGPNQHGPDPLEGTVRA